MASKQSHKSLRQALQAGYSCSFSEEQAEPWHGRQSITRQGQTFIAANIPAPYPAVFTSIENGKIRGENGLKTAQ